MAICPRTGVTIPECSCSACLEAQMRQHRPGGGEAEVHITRAVAGTRGRHRRRRAA